MHKFNLDAQAARIKLDLLKIGLLSRADSETKEYEADWLKPGQKVVRQGGKFAKKGGGGEAAPEISLDPGDLNQVGVNGTQVNAVRAILSPGEQKRLDQAISTLQKPGGLGAILQWKDKDDAKREIEDILKFYQVVADPKIFASAQKLGINEPALKSTLERLRVNKTQEKSTNHPLQQRVAELANFKDPADIPPQPQDWSRSIVTDEIPITWRKNIIQAEIKYGEALDGLVTVPSKTGGAGIANLFANVPDAQKLKLAHQKLLKQLREGKTNDSTSFFGGGKFFDKDKPALGFSVENHPSFGKPISTGEKDEDVKNAINSFDEFKSLTNTEISAVIDKTHERPFQSRPNSGEVWKRLLSLFRTPRLFINIGSTGDVKGTTFHELGHGLEKNLNWNGTIANSYLDDRSKQDKKQKDVGASMPGEKVRNTDFLNPHTGKEEGGTKLSQQGTEIISTGLQQLAHQSDTHNLATKDREHLLFSLSALDAPAYVYPFLRPRPSIKKP